MQESSEDLKNSEKTQESIVDNSNLKNKPYVMRNFCKELKRIRWPIQKQQNKNFAYIFIFILLLTGFFALISLGATQIIEWMGAK